MMKNKIVFSQNYEVDSFLFLHSLSENTKSTKPPANESNLNAEDGIKIYLKAVEKISLSIDESEKLLNDYLKIKNRPSEVEKAVKLKFEFTMKVDKARSIIEEFLRGLSVVHDLAAKEFMELLYNRFLFLSQNLELYYLTQKVSYLKDIRIMLKRLEESFTQMLDITVKSTPINTPTSSDFKV